MQNTTNDLFSLPAGPPELCFDKNEFKKVYFSVDEFLHKHRNAAGLEAMRDDLGLYLKVLRSAMIELINEDYADFVNLSSNLIGLDQSINGIQVPLGQLKEEIISVKMTLNDTMRELNNCLDMKKAMRLHLKSVQNVTNVQKSVQRLDDLLARQIGTVDQKLNPTQLERAALEYVQIEFNLQFCRKLIDPEFGPTKIENLQKCLMDKLRQHFITVFEGDSIDDLERCLRIYCTLDECKAAEELVRKNIIAPHMHLIISETSLQNSPLGLSGIYAQIIDFSVNKMGNLLRLTKSNGKVKGFDFVLNSFWIEVEKRIESHMQSIFAPGNPELFYQKYKCTHEFLDRLESVIGTADGISNFKNHPQYKTFQTKWNLPVYFQIRFQEIGGTLEKSCIRSFNEIVINENPLKSNFKLIPFATALTCILKCWSDGVYLPQIFVRFWKLTLQILSRITLWIDDGLAQTAWTNNDLKKIDFLVYLFMDIVRLMDKIPDILNVAIEASPVNVKTHLVLLEKCLNESKEMFAQKIVTVRQRIIAEIVVNSLISIKLISDIPRLYRKTNREIPSKPCAYVDQILEPIKSFSNNYSKIIDAQTVNGILVGIIDKLNNDYFTAVDDVLTSVQKTEESLRRLKNLREKSTANNSSSSTLDRMGMSDDDKIRLQLQVDVLHWTSEIDKLGVEHSQFSKLVELIKMLEEVTKIKVRN